MYVNNSIFTDVLTWVCIMLLLCFTNFVDSYLHHINAETKLCMVYTGFSSSQDNQPSKHLYRLKQSSTEIHFILMCMKQIPLVGQVLYIRVQLGVHTHTHN